MNQFAKEIYGQTTHSWYQFDLLTEHEYGSIFNTKEDRMPLLLETIKKDLRQEEKQEAIYWYFGKEIEDIKMMIRYKEGEFIIQINLKDFDFALNIDAIILWKEKLQGKLKEIEL